MNEEENKKTYEEGELVGDTGLSEEELDFILWEAYN